MRSNGTLDHHFINDAILLGLKAIHIKIAIRIRLNPLDGLMGVPHQNLIQLTSKPKDLPGLDVHIRCLPLETAHGLVNEDS